MDIVLIDYPETPIFYDFSSFADLIRACFLALDCVQDK